jgi:hypothetical protein
MATKKHAKRFNDGGIPEQTEEEAANEAEMMSSMMRKRAMDEGDRDEKAMPKQDFMSSKEPEAPAMRKTAMPKPKPNFSNEGRSSKAPAPMPTSSVKTTNVPKAIADFFRPKSASEKDSASRSALRESEKAKPKASMSFQERYASKGYASGGSVSASSRADGIATKGKTRGKIC